jgi:hypothetical protein
VPLIAERPEKARDDLLATAHNKSANEFCFARVGRGAVLGRE